MHCSCIFEGWGLVKPFCTASLLSPSSCLYVEVNAVVTFHYIPANREALRGAHARMKPVFAAKFNTLSPFPLVARRRPPSCTPISSHSEFGEGIYRRDVISWGRKAWLNRREKERKKKSRYSENGAAKRAQWGLRLALGVGGACCRLRGWCARLACVLESRMRLAQGHLL